MAEPVPISGGPEEAKIRSLWGVALLPLITFGIYFLVWYYKVNREMRDLGRKRQVQGLGDSPGTSLVAITLGSLIIVPAIISYINTYKRMKLAQQVVGVYPGDQMNGWIVVLGYVLIPPLAYAYQQDGLNKVWNIDSGRAPAGIPANAQQPAFQPMPPAGQPSPAPGVIPEAPVAPPPPAGDVPPPPAPPAPPEPPAPPAQ
ncbi:MAG: DUF4234 domain-containing protein [Actinobacteria bacterium]|nr:DUF4234 domain-containing protein [Actinomycetota bacterium]